IEFTSVTKYVPAIGYEFPFQLYGKADGQMLVFVVLVEVAFCVKFKVAMESHPTAFVNVTEYVPAIGYEFPFQLYGKAEGHMLMSVVLVEVAFCVKFNVATESHPTEFAN